MDELRLKLAEREEALDGVEDKLDRRQRRLAVLTGQSGDLAAALKRSPELKAMTPESVRAEIDRLSTERVALVSEIDALRAEIATQEKVARAKLIETSRPKIKRLYLEAAKALVAFCESQSEAMRVVHSTGVQDEIEAVRVPGWNADLSESYSPAAMYIRDLIRANYLTGSEKFLADVHWRES